MGPYNASSDVVVIGSGMAGLSAAIEARRAGADVVVLEKMKIPGGNSRISDGALSAPGCALQKAMHIEDSPERLYGDMMRAGQGMNHPGLARTVAQQALSAIEWTQDELGVRYMDRLDRFGGHSVARSITTASHCGMDIVRAQMKQLKTMGVEIRTRCLLKKLITDSAGGVQGVTVETGYQFPHTGRGKEVRIRARRAVILGTGGFSSDVRFRALLHPGLDRSFQTTNHKGATAEGLVTALEIGAFPVHLSMIQLGTWGCPDEKGYGKGARFASYSVFPAGILVDPVTGRRIVNEWGDRRERTAALLNTGHICIGIVDATGAESDAESLGYGLKSGKIKAFRELSAIETAHGMPAGELEKTVDAYNTAIEECRMDEFKKPLTRDAHKIETAPFYVIRMWPKIHYTPGGIAVNSDAQVLHLNGAPISGLHAAGEVCGGIHGAGRLGSNALTECLVFGRIAGKSAAGVL